MAKRRNTSPLDSQQNALKAQEEKVRQEMERLQQLIADAPKRQAEAARRQRDELIERSRISTRRYESRGALVDKRYDVNTGYTPSRPRPGQLKAERREARIKFFGLCILLIALLILLFSVRPF